MGVADVSLLWLRPNWILSCEGRERYDDEDVGNTLAIYGVYM